MVGKKNENIIKNLLHAELVSEGRGGMDEVGDQEPEEPH